MIRCNCFTLALLFTAAAAFPAAPQTGSTWPQAWVREVSPVTAVLAPNLTDYGYREGSRGVISYGTIDSDAPRRLHTVFALGALLGGVAPWPASPEMFALLPLLKPIGPMDSCRFADWRNEAVTLSDPRCASAIYSRSDEAFLRVANLDQAAREISCTLRPEKLPHPLARPAGAQLSARVPGNPSSLASTPLDLGALVGPGLKLAVPGDGALLIRVR